VQYPTSLCFQEANFFNLEYLCRLPAISFWHIPVCESLVRYMWWRSVIWGHCLVRQDGSHQYGWYDLFVMMCVCIEDVQQCQWTIGSDFYESVLTGH
jgi:hypothetical protein